MLWSEPRCRAGAQGKQPPLSSRSLPIHCASAQSLPLASSPEQEEIQNRGSTVTAPSLVECGLSAGSSGPECPAKTLGAREGEESSRVSWLGCPLYHFPNTSCLPPHQGFTHPSARPVPYPPSTCPSATPGFCGHFLLRGRDKAEEPHLSTNEGGGRLAPEASQVEAAGAPVVPGHHASLQEQFSSLSWRSHTCIALMGRCIL